jgi:3-deoxy-D-manno-octulosonic-acid transferase
MSRGVYTFALRLLLPFAILWFLWRGWRYRAYRGRLRETLALRLAQRTDRPVWLHAASVGEVQALAAVLRGLAPLPAPLLLTVGTPTGLAHARDFYRDLLQSADARLVVQLAPWDLPGVAARFLQANRPRAAVFVETELWPNLLAACAHRQVPLLLISARISARSLHRYQRFAARMMHAAVRAFAVISAQSDADRQRFIALGAMPERVSVDGNLKFDLPLPADIGTQAATLRTGIGARPIWVAGSTHSGEEAICVNAHRRVLAAARAAGRPLPLLVLAPRRPERFAEVAQWLDSSGLQVGRISQPGGHHAAPNEVLLLDTMGALLAWYAAADVAFVGGTLVPVGGHNLLEPAALGKPVIAGPHTFNSPEAATLLREAAALTTAADEPQLFSALQDLLGDAEQARASGARGAAVVAANRGAASRALALVAALAGR